MENTDLVATSPKASLSGLVHNPISPQGPQPSSQTREETSIETSTTGFFSYIREALREQNIPDASADIIIASWRTATRKTYAVYLNRWIKYAKRRHFNFLSPAPSHIIAFLTRLYKKGAGYSAINTARSAINQLVSVCSEKNFGSCIILNKFMKGIFELRPALPKYNEIWDVQTVLDYIKRLPEDLTLMTLSGKLAVLFLLLTAQRCQTLHLINLSDIFFVGNKMIIHLNNLLKQSRPGKHPGPLVLESYELHSSLCIVKVFKEYIDRTKDLRNSEKLLVSTQRPHKGIAKATVSRWVRTFLHKAGVLSCYGPHSIRSAATSKAKSRGIPLQSLLKTAGWDNVSTFAKFYDKVIQPEISIQTSLLS